MWLSRILIAMIAVSGLVLFSVSCNEDTNNSGRTVDFDNTQPAVSNETPEVAEPEPAPEPAKEPAAEAEAPAEVPEPAAGTEATEPAETEAEAPADGTGEEQPAAEPAAETEDQVAEDAPSDATEAGETVATEEETVEDAGAVEEEVEGFEADVADLMEDMPSEPADPIEAFRNMDPRDIIQKKYDDLANRKTAPWDPEWEIGEPLPETGRDDPLTRVSSAVPKELRPPRAGETDQNEINTYVIAQQATAIVTSIAYSLQCESVMQIGLQKQAIFNVPGTGLILMDEGQSMQFGVGSVDGIPLVCSITCRSISTDEVVLSISCYGQGTTTVITKNQVYIPNGYQ